jgi:hypothetical protein
MLNKLFSHKASAQASNQAVMEASDELNDELLAGVVGGAALPIKYDSEEGMGVMIEVEEENYEEQPIEDGDWGKPVDVIEVVGQGGMNSCKGEISVHWEHTTESTQFSGK